MHWQMKMVGIVHYQQTAARATVKKPTTALVTKFSYLCITYILNLNFKSETWSVRTRTMLL